MSGSTAADIRWERFLWEKHHAVALSVAEVGDLQPLAVLVKLQSKEKKSGFTIRKVGSLSSLRKHGSDPEDSSELRWRRFDERCQASLAAAGSALNRTATGRQGRQAQPSAAASSRNPVREVVEVKSEPEIKFVDTSSTSCLFDLFASCGRFHARRLEARVQGIRSVSLSPQETMPLFTAEPPAWKPDLTKLQQLISWDGLPRSETAIVELWVVIEVRYCTCLSLSWQKGGGAQIGVDVPAEAVAAITGMTTGVPVPVPIRASLKAEHDKHTLTVSSADSRSPHVIPFAFKAIRLAYDRESGNLVDKHLDKGDQPLRRGHARGNKEEEKHYSMADFFESDEQGKLVFQCLAMESVDGGVLVHLDSTVPTLPLVTV